MDVELLYSTKVYGYGKDDKPVIWRNTLEDSEVYIINGPFMDTNVSYGFLSAILSKVYEDYIYPVINARLMIYEGFPFISNENEKNLNKLYNRDAMKFQYDILMPNILTMNSSRDFIPNGYFTFGFKGSSTKDINESNIEKVNNIRDQIYTSGGDVDLKYTGDLKRDKQTYKKVFKNQKVTSVLMDNELTSLKDILTSSDNLESIVGPWGDRNTFEYLNDSVVYIPLTADGVNFTSQDKLEFLSGVTAFGAIVEALSLEDLVLNDGDTENWTRINKRYSRFVDDYRERFEFVKSRNTESTTRAVKAFKSNKPRISVADDKITLVFNKWNGPSYFILRTEKEIIDVSGGKAEKIEDNAYLITANGVNVEVFLKESENINARR